MKYFCSAFKPWRVNSVTQDVAEIREKEDQEHERQEKKTKGDL